MKKIILFPILFLLSLFLVNAVTLIDSEDFESYSIGGAWDTLINESNFEWNCSSGYTDEDYCVQNNGGGSPDANATFSIVTANGSKALSFYAHTTDGSNYDKIGLEWDFTNTSGFTTPRTNFTLKYDLRIDSPSDLATGSGSNSVKRLFWNSQGAMQHDFLWYSTPRIDAQISDTFGCTESISANDFNSVTVNIYPTEGLSTFTQEVFFNGVPCSTYSGTSGSSTFFPMTELFIKAEKSSVMFLDNIEIYEGILGANETYSPPVTPPENCTDTNCSTWDAPYFLKEEFIGLINECDWSVTEDVCYTGTLTRLQNESYYSIYKNPDTVQSDVTRYFTISFDLKPTDVATNGWISLSLYDSDFQRFVQFLVGENGDFYNNDGGDTTLSYGNVSTTLSKNVNLHVDFTDDDFDLWYDGVKVASSLGFTDSFLNIDTFYGLRISSDNAEYEIENLEIYATDQDNNLIIIDSELPVTPDADLSVCGLFNRVTPTCTEDSDCSTDSCLPNGKCNSFDMNYCDENGHTRGNKCIISGVTNCVLESTADIILDNFLLFLVFLILLILVVYLIYAMK